MEEKVEEEYFREPLTVDEVEDLADNSSEILHSQTGVYLPRLTPTPVQAARSIRYVPLGIELPLGSLFYPCCGSDTEHAMTAFSPYVIDCHFADPYFPPHGRSRPAPKLKSIFVPNLETVVVGGRLRGQIDNANCPVHSHEKDGLLTLIEDIPLLSVFYYRGDGIGEGGSNQLWLKPVLFHTVLARLLDGGIIATEGANCGCGDGFYSRSIPWSSLCAENEEKLPFVYANREFRIVDKLKNRGRVLHLWQVTSESR